MKETTKEDELPKGYNCVACGMFHKFPEYVYAHTHVNLTHKCECGAKHVIRDCVAARIE